MRITTTIDDDTISELMRLAQTESKTEAVNRAVASFIRQERVKRFKNLRGKLDMPSNEALETAELERDERLASRDG